MDLTSEPLRQAGRGICRHAGLYFGGYATLEPQTTSSAPRPLPRGHMYPLRGAGSTPGARLLPLVVLRQAYPAHHAPGVEVAGGLVVVAVARYQHHDAPVVDVLQVHGGGGAQVAGEGLGGLQHHLPPDPSLGDRAALRGGRPLPVHHGPLLCSPLLTGQDTSAEGLVPPATPRGERGNQPQSIDTYATITAMYP